MRRERDPDYEGYTHSGILYHLKNVLSADRPSPSSKTNIKFMIEFSNKIKRLLKKVFSSKRVNIVYYLGSSLYAWIDFWDDEVSKEELYSLAKELTKAKLWFTIKHRPEHGKYRIEIDSEEPMNQSFYRNNWLMGKVLYRDKL